MNIDEVDYIAHNGQKLSPLDWSKNIYPDAKPARRQTITRTFKRRYQMYLKGDAKMPDVETVLYKHIGTAKRPNIETKCFFVDTSLTPLERIYNQAAVVSARNHYR